MLRKIAVSTICTMENQSTFSVNIQDLVRLDIKRPGNQRIVVEQKADEIVERQRMFFQRDNRFNFMPALNIHFVREAGSYFIVDGQHRMRAMQKLRPNEQRAGMVKVLLVTVDTMDQMRENFDMINRNTIMPDLPVDVDRETLEGVFNYFAMNRYPRSFRTSNKPARPFLNPNTFQEAISVLQQRIKDPSIRNIIKAIEGQNTLISTWTSDECSRKITRRVKKWDQYRKKAESLGFFLGLYRKENDSYIYRWVRDVLGVHPKVRPPKRAVPKAIKKAVWAEFVGDRARTTCFCCRINPIEQIEYDAGHVIAESKGGPTTVKNLRPICSPCNGEMGASPMTDFMMSNDTYRRNLLRIDGISKRHNALAYVSGWKRKPADAPPPTKTPPTMPPTMPPTLPF